MPKQRVTDLGPSERVCAGCGGHGTLVVKQIQDMRRWGPLRLKDREPYRVARCSTCRTTIPVRRDDT